MPALLLILFALLRIALMVAAVFAVAAAIYYHHRNEQLELQAQDLKTRLQQLQQRDTHRTESFATTVHELRAPLTSIRGALVLLSAGALSPRHGIGSLDERAANLLRIAAGNTGRLVRLIDELLELERMDSGPGQIDLRPCLLDAVLAQAVDIMGPMAQAAAIKIKTEAAPASPLYFSGDASRIAQVLCNLLSNAIKFSPHGSTVTLNLRAESSHLVLRVEDRGRGIPANKLEAVFERFVRLGPPLSAAEDPTRPGSSATSGSGLGLAISRGLVAQHNGTLHAERNDSVRPGRAGTTFVLRLPRILQEPAAEAADADSISAPPHGRAIHGDILERSVPNRPDSERPSV